MANVNTKVEGNKLVVTIDLAAQTAPSKSGKTQVVATTGGNLPVSGPNGQVFYLGVNCYKK